MTKKPPKFYPDIIWALGKDYLINDVFQVTVSYYDLEKQCGKYLFTACDIDSSFKLCHRLWDTASEQFHYDMTNFNKNYNELLNKYSSNDETKKLIDSLIKSDKRVNLCSAFEILKQIDFPKPLVMSDFIKKSLKDNQSCICESLMQNTIYKERNKNKTPNWDLGVFIEDQLFNVRNNTFYLCVFFINTSEFQTEHKIYSVNVFHQKEKDSNAIGNVIKNKLKTKKTGNYYCLLDECQNREQLKNELHPEQITTSVQIAVPEQPATLNEAGASQKEELITLLRVKINSDIPDDKKFSLSTILSLVEKADNESQISKVRSILEANPTCPDENLEKAMKCLRNMY